MKAWRLNDYEWYAADTLEQAIQCAMETTGGNRDDVYVEGFGSEPEEDTKLVWEDEDMKKQVTVGELLKTFTEPCFAFGTE